MGEETLQSHEFEYTIVDSVESPGNASMTFGEKVKLWRGSSQEQKMAASRKNDDGREGNSTPVSRLRSESSSMSRSSDLSGAIMRDQWEQRNKLREEAAKARRKQRELDENAVLEDLEVTQAADRIFAMFVEPWNGCGEEAHQASRALHDLDSHGKHHDLDITYDPQRQHQSYRSRLGLAQEGFPRQTGLSRDSFDPASKLQATFEGSSDSTKPPSVCVHVEHENVESHTVCTTRDTDSMIFFPSSLEAFRKTFKMCSVYQVSRNITTPLHFPFGVSVFDQRGNLIPTMLEFKDIPHTYLGYMEGIANTVLLGFPRLHRKDQANNFLTKQQQSRLYDEVILPSIRKHILPGGPIGSVPRTQELADKNAYAKGKEKQTKGEAKIQMHHWAIPTHAHGQIWQEMLDVIDGNPTLSCFKDMVLLVDIKGVKNQTSHLDLFESMDFMDEVIEEHFDERFIPEERNLLDLGAVVEALSPDNNISLGQYTYPAITYGWRRCCTNQFLSSLKEDGFDGKKGASRVFTVAGLWDLTAVTIEPPKQCYLYRGGLRYIQRYGCAKHLFDAMGTYLFEGRAIPDICLCDSSYAAAVTETHSSHVRRRDDGFNQFSESKSRAHMSLTCKVLRSYGIRLEVRIQRKLWRALKKRARHQHDNNVPATPNYSNHAPEAAFSVYTRRFNDYLYGNYDKYVTLLEMCAVTTPLSGRTLHRARFMRVLVELLEQFFNSPIQEHPALWVSKRETIEGKGTFGMGFEKTLQRYGYAWVYRNRVDWDALQLCSKVSLQLSGYIDRSLVQWFPRAVEAIGEITEGRLTCMNYLQYAPPNKSLQQAIMVTLAHKLFRAYRREVLITLKFQKKLQTVGINAIRDDSVRFSWDGLTAALMVPLHAMGGGQKQKVTSPSDLFRWLWLDDEEVQGVHVTWKLKRTSSKNWNFEFRNMFRTLRRQFLQYDSTRELKTQFEQLVFKEFFTYHWAIPYPDPAGGFIGKTKERHLPIFNVEIVRSGDSKFYWSKRSYQHGVPPEYPRMSRMPDHELRGYFRELGG